MTNFNSGKMIFGCEIRIETQLLEVAELVLEVGFLILLKTNCIMYICEREFTNSIPAK